PATAHGGFSPSAFWLGVLQLLGSARSAGMAAMGANRCLHFSALWVEVEALTEAGLVALATTPSHAWVAPAGGRKPIFGTNPIAFGWPRPDCPPFFFDFATSAVARGEIQLHERAGKTIPPGSGVVAMGEPPPADRATLNGAQH
ncbi:Ldh family oxidoreductase, partial [Pseudomonas aeruginosa]